MSSKFTAVQNRLHQNIYTKTNGILGHRLLIKPCLLMTTVGAKTGLPRTNLLTYTPDPQNPKNCIVIASNAGQAKNPSWYFNVKANPNPQIQIGRKKYTANATILSPTDPDYTKHFDTMNKYYGGRYGNYQKMTERPLPVIIFSHD